MGSVHFFQEDVDFSLEDEEAIIDWIVNVISAESMLLENLNYIFCSDSYLHNINLKYLNHDEYTDIITFDNAEAAGIIDGDIFMSIERIHDNSVAFNKPFINELYRVIIHGALHLSGYSDKNQVEQIEMRMLEDKYISWITNS